MEIWVGGGVKFESGFTGLLGLSKKLGTV
jgi:hypothetical protein